MTPYILKMRPYLREKVWGGTKLRDLVHKAVGDGGPYGEAREVADLPEGKSFITNGPLADQSLAEAVGEWDTSLIGNAADVREGFPLLVKLLDAADDLSVQVHPSQQDVRTTHPDADSKDETWLILDAEPDGTILHGVRDGVDAPTLREAVEEGHAEETLRRIDVSAGDVVRVVPGTIHAICAGVSLLEIQEPSDTTYRVYDYKRPGLDGELRQLHLEDALAVANFGEQPPAKLSPESLDHPDAARQLLVGVDRYRIEQLTGETGVETAERTVRWQIDDRSAQVVMALAGHLRLQTDDTDQTVELDPYETAVIPAACDGASATPIDDAPYKLIGATAYGVDVFTPID